MTFFSFFPLVWYNHIWMNTVSKTYWQYKILIDFSNFSYRFLNPSYFFWKTSKNKLKKYSVTKNCSDLFTNCSSDLKSIANSRPSASNFKNFSRSLEQFFLTVGQNNFGNKIPLPFQKLSWFFWKWFSFKNIGFFHSSISKSNSIFLRQIN